ncbi:hypothetical protein H9Y05_15810 [Crocinitomicaceae bacterium CZZ-1]|uniref:Uncharacterized protein n=1 Tax=Taishania pollutisoli TaxID=2766479 RepID=A0A8J6U1H3_9FLAO|nr:hypothetical protein [Taishania pollutisoli]MBC9813943.1 hypothetical protein [Taishania pollutisoli]
MSNKWESYAKIGGNKVGEFFTEYFGKPNKKLLYIMGKGFDVRMNSLIQVLINSCSTVNVECLLVDYNESSDSASKQYSSFVDTNLTELKTLLDSRSLIRKPIDLFSGSAGKRKWIGDRTINGIIPEDLSEVTDIIVDIGALQRSVYPSLIGTLLSLIEQKQLNINLFVGVTENARIDALITEVGTEHDLKYLHGFGGNIEITSEAETPIIWFPFLGEGKMEQLKKAQDQIIKHTRPYEICPVLPFPSKDLRRSDALIMEYHEWLFDASQIASKDIIYVPEQNPFEAYIRLNNAIRNYNESLKTLGGCKAIVSNFSSKLLSIGSILSAYELKNDIGVGLLNVPSEGYNIRDENEMQALKSESQSFLMWLTGDPYK